LKIVHLFTISLGKSNSTNELFDELVVVHCNMDRELKCCVGNLHW